MCGRAGGPGQGGKKGPRSLAGSGDLGKGGGPRGNHFLAGSFFAFPGSFFTLVGSLFSLVGAFFSFNSLTRARVFSGSLSAFFSQPLQNADRSPPSEAATTRFWAATALELSESQADFAY